ncbi:MAG: D-alanyl-D-alanine carboxypeptidase/D-alanyl-D-alanine-endopeptidase [Actinomycetota bacterium]
MRRTAYTIALVLALLSPFLVSAVAQAESASLQLTPPRVTWGESQRASGLVAADQPCAAGRAVALERRETGATVWEDIDSTTSGDDGTFTFTFTAPTNAAYRAVVQAGLLGSVTCNEIDSAAAKGTVLAKVSLTAGRARIHAGDCVRLTSVVQPVKQGQDVRVQERSAAGWRTVSSATLDASSRAVDDRCFAWTGIGSHRFRMLWPKQDDLNAPGASRTVSIQVLRAPWMQRIDALTAGRTVGVSIRAAGRVLYERAGQVPLIPASNEKLLLSMALLDRMDPTLRIPTIAAAPKLGGHGVVHGNLWILGRGDPSIGKGDIVELAKAIVAAGVHRITGRVMGSTSYFAHDWFARGWKPEFPKEELGLPSALTFRENHIDGRNPHDPERFAAEALTRRLRAGGVRVHGSPGSGSAPGALRQIAAIQSPPLAGLMTQMDQTSDNFFAEVLGKVLGVSVAGVPGTIAKGAGAIRGFAARHGVHLGAYDSSGLSYANRVSPDGVTKLLEYAARAEWGDTLLDVLASPGEGTLEDRLHGVQVHAKTGTLEDISALSGFVWVGKLQAWAEFSILDRGMCSCRSKPMEDAIVRTIAKAAR